MNTPVVHVIQILIRHQRDGEPVFLLHPHETWRRAGGPSAYLVLPAKKTVGDAMAPFLQGHSLETFVSEVMEDQLGLAPREWLLEHEISPAQATFPAVHSGDPKTFVLCPVEVWVAPQAREGLRDRIGGRWVTAAEALADPQLAPSARAVFGHLLVREAELDRRYAKMPEEEAREEYPRRLFRRVSDQPSMYALACRWLSRNRGGVRILERDDLDTVLAAGSRAFNLRVADPYLRYQLQGVGFTWSFFTHKDRQDVHVHSAPSVEIYGVLEGRLEVWWKPYHDRGTSAWNHRMVGPGDWVEMDALQCHYVRWLGEGKGVVFKAGPGPLAEVGRLGVKGKTTCDTCPCIKPPEMLAPPQSPSPKAPGKRWGLSVRAVITDADGRLLLLRRHPGSRFFPGAWELPGGKVDAGEAFDLALSREVREETGLEVAVAAVLGATEFELPHIRVVHLFHQVEVTGGTLAISSEHSESRWVAPGDVTSLELALTVREFLLSRGALAGSKCNSG